jgi:hypothetical protein
MFLDIFVDSYKNESKGIAQRLHRIMIALEDTTHLKAKTFCCQVFRSKQILGNTVDLIVFL